MSYQAPPQQLPTAQPPQPSNAPHGAHALNSGPQPGTAPATQHSQAGPTSGQAYGPHAYTEPAKPKKGQQLWNRMKRKRAAQGNEGVRHWVLGWSHSREMATWSCNCLFLGLEQLQGVQGRPNPSFCCLHSCPWDWWSQV